MTMQYWHPAHLHQSFKVSNDLEMFNYTPIFADSALSGTALYNSITVDEHPNFFINQLLAKDRNFINCDSALSQTVFSSYVSNYFFFMKQFSLNTHNYFWFM